MPRLKRHRRILAATLACGPLLLAGCSPLHGYPTDPENTAATSEQLRQYFEPTWEQRYEEAGNDQARQAIRNQIVLNRMRAYEISYSDFKRRLTGDSNAIASGGDLIVLLLSGLGATTGGVAAKSALAAASAGIVGAQGAINKDLYFQRTLPALLAQMDANRLQVQAHVISRLSEPVSSYPLPLALLDLDQLRDAGGVPTAIGGLTLQAENTKLNAAATNANAENDFRGGAADVAAIDEKNRLNTQIMQLQPAQQVALANLELMTRFARLTSVLQADLHAMVPASGRFQAPPRALQFLHEWVIQELPTDQSRAAWKADLATVASKQGG